MVWTCAALLSPLALWAQTTAPAARDYVGPGIAQPTSSSPGAPANPGGTSPGGTAPAGTSPAPTSPSPKPPAPNQPLPNKPPGDLSMDDVFGAPNSGPEGPAELPSAREPTGSQVNAGVGADKTPGELGMDDVFGSTTPAKPEPPKSTREASVPTISPLKGLIDAENPGADKGGGAPTSSYGGKLRTRFRLVSSVYGDVDRASPRRLSRNENRLELYVAYTPNKHVQVVADAEPVLMGVSQARELDDLASQTYIQRFHMESDAAYVALTDLAPGLDIKIGRQIVVWGTADKFNPTNNINADDVEDRPLFTEPIANQMAVVDYAPLGDRLYLQGVYVPMFFPALLPPSAAYGLKDPFAEVPFSNQVQKDKINYLQENFLPANPKFTPNVFGHVVPPENAFKNGQAAFKLGSRLGDVDLSASYYYGRHDFPIPKVSHTSMTAPLNGDVPADGYYFRSDVDLIYPKMQVIGLDFATQLPFLGNMGLWGEGALIIPKQHIFSIDLPVPGGIDVTPDNGVMDKETVVVGPVVEGKPFIKAAAGFDYTFGKHVYVQAQYLRGFINEFGAGHMGNYLVGGTELIFFGRKLVFRNFGLIDFPGNNPKKFYRADGSLSSGGSSGVYAPSLLFAPPWGYVNFEVGGFALFGANKTYFGQSAAGSSIAYVKVIGSF